VIAFTTKARLMRVNQQIAPGIIRKVG